MSNLIDGVIAAGSYVGVQCLQFVTDVTGIATGQNGTHFGTAGELADYAQSQGILHNTPQLGDVAVYVAGKGGAGSAGHAGIVTSLSGGQVGVTSTNWGTAGSGAEQNVVGLTGGQPSGYINPGALGGKNIITGVTSTTGLQQSGFSVTPTGTYTTLSDEINKNQSVVPGVGPVTGFAAWISQGQLLRRIGFSAVGVFLMWYGLHLLTRIDSPTQVVTGVAKKVAAA